MIGFVVGVLVGFGLKTAYDFIQEERIPTDLGMAQGRSEAILDETRQLVRELRDELRQSTDDKPQPTSIGGKPKTTALPTSG